MFKNILFYTVLITAILATGSISACDKEVKTSTFKLSSIDPTPETNPAGANFPGVRGGDQLIQYTKTFGNYTTTNEYGTEITIIKGIVVDKNGSNSNIPEEGFVLSGHGTAKKWLNADTIIGSKVVVDKKNNTVTSITSPESYNYRAKQMLEEAKPLVDRHQANQYHVDAVKSFKSAQNALNESDKLLTEQKWDEAIKLANNAYADAEMAYYKSLPSILSMERGVWCRPVEDSPEAIDKTLDKIKLAGINTVYLETFFHGYTIYPSQVMVEYGFSKQNTKFNSFDPLKVWVEKAHNKGIKVYTWVETFYVGTSGSGPILSVKPEWANIQLVNANKTELKPSTLEPGAFFLDPANPEAREFIVKITSEMARYYDIDGINLDYIRYPNSLPEHFPDYLSSTWGYTDYARSEFKQIHGQDPLELTPDDKLWSKWIKYRQEKVNAMVREVYSKVKRVKPSISLSAVVFPDIDKASVQKLQDWMCWVDGGYIDVLTPIILGSSPELIKQYCVDMVSRCESKCKIYIGIFGAFNNDIPVNFVKQIMSTRNTGVSGINIFDLAHLKEQYVKALTEGPFK